MGSGTWILPRHAAPPGVFAEGVVSSDRRGATTVVKPEWGIKRLCQSCGARYYDFLRTPIVCPSCGTTFDSEAVLKSRRARPLPVDDVKPKARKKEVDEEAEDVEDEVEEEEDLDEEEDVIDDDDTEISSDDEESDEPAKRLPDVDVDDEDDEDEVGLDDDDGDDIAPIDDDGEDLESDEEDR
jgi:uncharacterized protein (TIGR02300 family)